MHHSDFDAHRLLCDTAAPEPEFLPRDRQARSGRTQDRMWEPGRHAIAIERHRAANSTTGWDIAGWIGSAVLIAFVLLVIYAPGWLECFGALAKR